MSMPNLWPDVRVVADILPQGPNTAFAYYGVNPPVNPGSLWWNNKIVPVAQCDQKNGPVREPLPIEGYRLIVTLIGKWPIQVSDTFQFVYQINKD